MTEGIKNSDRHPQNIRVTSDIVVLLKTTSGKIMIGNIDKYKLNIKVLLVKRKNNPEKGKWALPGGHLNDNEPIEDACIRELKEKTNLDIDKKDLEPISFYDDVGTNKEERYITFAYMNVIKDNDFDMNKLQHGDDATSVKFMDLNKLKREDIAFTHYDIILDALRKLAGIKCKQSIDKYSHTISNDIETFEDGLINIKVRDYGMFSATALEHGG